jgi:hypothetical protein
MCESQGIVLARIFQPPVKTFTFFTMPLSCVAASSNKKMEDRISYAGGALWNFTIMALYGLNQPSSITEISNKTKHVI